MPDATPPPPPPPLPELPQNDTCMRASQIQLKVRKETPKWLSEPRKTPIDPPTGTYFFYGTLSDPQMLTDVLGTNEEPVLRPAKIVGHHAMLWGQYPAIIDGEAGEVVTGRAYVVQSVNDGKRLAEYETRNYEIRPCIIKYTDGEEPTEAEGYVFMFAGDRDTLKEGIFDLDVWLKRVGRA